MKYISGKLSSVGFALAFGVLTPMVANADNSIAIDVAIGKACWVEAYSNSAATWTMTVTNGDATAAVFSGSGVNFSQMPVVQGSARFDVTGRVVATFASTINKAEVKAAATTINGDSGVPAVFHTLIGGEDGGDDDWQDILASFTCLHNAG